MKDIQILPLQGNWYNSGCVNRRRRVRSESLGTWKKTGKAYVRLYRARQQKTQTNIVGDVHVKLYK